MLYIYIMKIFKIGSCRIGKNTNNKNDYQRNYIHNLKQILLTLKYLLNMNNDKSKFDKIQRSYNREGQCPPDTKEINLIKEKLKNCSIVIIEISSLKIWKNHNKELIHWSNYIKDTKINFFIKQDKEDFFKDLKEIYSIINSIKKKLIIFSHINIPINNFKKKIKCNEEVRWICNDFDKKNIKYTGNNISCENIKETFIQSRNNIEIYIDEFLKNNDYNIKHIKPYKIIKESKFKMN
jgi:hypothetical protein